jgi:hypothetical protein
LVSPGEGWSRTAAALSHLSRLFSRRTAIHTTTGTSRVINKMTAIADSNQAFDPETCLPSVSDDTVALTVTRTAVPPYHPGSGITRRLRRGMCGNPGAVHVPVVFMAMNVNMPMPDMPDIAFAG